MSNKIARVAIATPTYNEAKNVPRLIKSIAKACADMPKIDFTVLVIDDNSPDKTADVVEKTGKLIKQKNVHIEVLRREKKNGLGRAYVDGFSYLIKKGYDCIIQMDADMSHNPKYLVNFVELAEQGHDFIAASRYVPGGSTPDWGLHRKIMSRGGNLYTRLFLGSTITDYTGGYNLYSAKLLKKIDITSLRAGGYGFLIELKYRALQVADSPAQFAIVFHDRQHGTSKIPKRTILKNFVLVPKIRFTSTFKK